MAWSPCHGNFDIGVFCKYGVDVGAKENGGILGWMQRGVKDCFQGRGGVTVELDLCNGGAVVELSADKV